MSKFPSSIREINQLSVDEKQLIYKTLIPQWVLQDYNISPDLISSYGEDLVNYICPAGSRAMEIILKREIADRDPLLYLNIADTFNNQLLVLLVIVNDPDAPRYNIDIDAHGNTTHFGTSGRNVPAEILAMKAGLAPGQVKKGLRAFKRSVPVFEDFVANMGHNLFLIEPLAYHNAIVFERYGFNYVRGLKDMQQIHQGFQPDGELSRRLRDDNPFRQPNFARTVRGRSWAIHDGILGHPFTGFQMYKRVGIHAGIETFPSAIW